ncbi:MAG: 23S rRNA (adenine(2503)-C(2))-methyltransferase RlmN [Selenomonadaceae bacterium]|nr:23S rRNA (adenine(2503)-C(2))-methyltransferase RlmN [Selenomonadaceae bacterium]
MAAEAVAVAASNIFGLSLEELTAEFSLLKLPKFRAKQIAAWIYQRGATSFEQMTDLPKSLRDQLIELYEIRPAKLITQLDSTDSLTTKFLLGLSDGAAVETVLMRHDYGNSVCISTQVGCAMGCKFCASTILGLERNLSAAEILSEVLFVNSTLEERIDNIVIMGIGEPLMNYDNLIKFLKMIHAEYTIGLSYRKITVSTCGIVPNIYKLSEEDLPITLSISLHAPNNELRSRLMPINENFHIDEVVKAGRDYGEKTGRRVTYEYILIAEVNDTKEHALQLSRLLSGQLCNVNLIPINPVAERNFKRPSKESVNNFADYLNNRGITATVRKEMGANINAACGQLRLRKK